MNESTPRSRKRNDENPRRVLLLGTSGRLGTAIFRAFESGATATAAGFAPGADADRATPAPRIELLAPSRGALALDERKPLEAARRWFEAWKPDVVVNCIAMSDVDRCEQEPLDAMRMNAQLPGALARAARRHDSHLIHFSTDFVFDGRLRRPYREDDPAAPLSVYGESKLSGEKAVASENPSYWVFRISWLHGGSERNLAARLLDPANAGRTIALASDRIGVPNPVQLLAREVVAAITRIVAEEQPPSGVYHLSCHGQTTWHEFGREFVTRAIDAGRIAPGRAPRIEAMNEKAASRPARRPEWSALDPSRYESAFDRRLPDWRNAIAFALEQK